MRVRTGNQSVIVVVVVSVVCILFVYAASTRVEDASGRVDPKASMLAPGKS
ncbi:hypothetical protein [Ferranicluibacter rubi]|uniref:Uncharacterized protein n=1 Tax=Ferranicluibacter rubi TaxID=2715133 RepID=A0AA43ZFD8_9HYPH|nr:hypothetical protein [Ferranicluibacter rubi]NHT75862.1 hypothetical protein [Ferranicluibacter rubi]